MTTTSQVIDQIRSTSAIQETSVSRMANRVRLQKASETVAGHIIADTAEISQNAMNKYLAEIKR